MLVLTQIALLAAALQIPALLPMALPIPLPLPIPHPLPLPLPLLLMPSNLVLPLSISQLAQSVRKMKFTTWEFT